MLRSNCLLLVFITGMMHSATGFASPNFQHSHAGRVHSHALPSVQKFRHRHVNGAVGQRIGAAGNVSVKPKPTRSLQRFYAVLPTAQKQSIQESLAWVTDSPVPLDLPFGRVSYNLIKQWQKASGYVPDGKLNATQIKRLQLGARIAKRAVNWTIYRSANDHFQIGVPSRLAQKKSFNEAGGIEFSSPNKAYTLSLMATSGDGMGSILDAGKNSLQGMYQEMLKQFKSEGLSNIRQRRNAAGFMLSGTQNGEILYVNFAKKGNGHAGYLLSLPYTQATRSGTNTLIAATALSFKVDSQSQQAKDQRYTQKLNKRSVPLQIKNRGTQPLTAEAIFSKVNQAVWLLRPSNNSVDSQGSAVAINRHYLLTNCHVMGNSTRGQVLHKGTQAKTLAVTLYAADRRNDRCVLHSRKPLPRFVSVRPYKNMNVGEKVYTIGAPQGFSLTIAEGLLSSKREDGSRRLLQTSAPISQGSSGGGLFDAYGNLLGITTLMSRRGQNLNFAIPAEEYWAR
ncbi:MAG: S1C family serine protease [Leucothrix sp.]